MPIRWYRGSQPGYCQKQNVLGSRTTYMSNAKVHVPTCKETTRNSKTALSKLSKDEIGCSRGKIEMSYVIIKATLMPYLPRSMSQVPRKWMPILPFRYQSKSRQTTVACIIGIYYARRHFNKTFLNPNQQPRGGSKWVANTSMKVNIPHQCTVPQIAVAIFCTLLLS